MNILEYKYTDSRIYVRYEDDGEEKWWCLSAHVLTDAAPESSEVLMSASDVVENHSPILGMHLPANVFADHLRKNPSASFSTDYFRTLHNMISRRWESRNRDAGVPILAYQTLEELALIGGTDQTIGERKRFENIALAVCGGLLFGQVGMGLVAGIGRSKQSGHGEGE